MKVAILRTSDQVDLGLSEFQTTEVLRFVGEIAYKQMVHERNIVRMDSRFLKKNYGNNYKEFVVIPALKHFIDNPFKHSTDNNQATAYCIKPSWVEKLQGGLVDTLEVVNKLSRNRLAKQRRSMYKLSKEAKELAEFNKRIDWGDRESLLSIGKKLVGTKDHKGRTYVFDYTNDKKERSILANIDAAMAIFTTPAARDTGKHNGNRIVTWSCLVSRWIREASTHQNKTFYTVDMNASLPSQAKSKLGNGKRFSYTKIAEELNMTREEAKVMVNTWLNCKTHMMPHLKVHDWLLKDDPRLVKNVTALKEKEGHTIIHQITASGETELFKMVFNQFKHRCLVDWVYDECRFINKGDAIQASLLLQEIMRLRSIDSYVNVSNGSIGSLS